MFIVQINRPMDHLCMLFSSNFYYFRIIYVFNKFLFVTPYKCQTYYHLIMCEMACTMQDTDDMIKYFFDTCGE